MIFKNLDYGGTMVDINTLLSIYKKEDVDRFLKKITGKNLTERNLKYDDVKEFYHFIGDNESNVSSIHILAQGEKGLVERLTNSIDAVIEKQYLLTSLRSPKGPWPIVENRFPEYYQRVQEVLNETKTSRKLDTKDADGMITLTINDGSASNKPTFDVIDKGTGLSGAEFPDTILSIHKGNKIKRDKSHLIGAFGQGGSTSLPFTYATLIISKKDNEMSFTVIKSVDLIDYKNSPYMYVRINGKVPEVDFSNFKPTGKKSLDDFVQGESGTLVRMIETDISVEFRRNAITKPGMLFDYLNTELFHVGLPIKLVENRKRFYEDGHTQNRNVYGTYLKLKTQNKYLQERYSGSMKISYNNREYHVEFFVLLPHNEQDWAKDSVCKNIYKQFNIHEGPILYIANGQTITTEGFTKLKNRGLSFLKYRLLVVVNLDSLEHEKYKFFTSERSRIVLDDTNKGFIDELINKIVNIDKLKEINNIIAEKSYSEDISSDVIKDISRKVKNKYNKFLKSGVVAPHIKPRPSPKNEEVLGEEINEIIITNTKPEYYKNDNINIVVKTGVYNYINKSISIDMFLNENNYTNFTQINMNGRIEFQINAGDLIPGEYKTKFYYYKTDVDILETDYYSFKVLDLERPDAPHGTAAKDLDLDIKQIEGSDNIVEIVKNEIEKKITVYICLNHERMKREIYGLKADTERIAIIRSEIIYPVAIFALFYGNNYDELETEKKNDLIIAFIVSYLSKDEQRK